MEARFGALPRGTRLLDKTALNTVHLDWILTLFPRARIIFALRDARDVLISCHLQSFAPSALTAHCDEWQESARFYAEVLGHWEAMREVHALSCVTLRYEALVADLRGSMHDVLAFLGLEWQPGMQEFQRGARARTISTPSYAEVVEPLYARAVGRWRPYARRDHAHRADHRTAAGASWLRLTRLRLPPWAASARAPGCVSAMNLRLREQFCEGP